MIAKLQVSFLQAYLKKKYLYDMVAYKQFLFIFSLWALFYGVKNRQGAATVKETEM